MATSQAQGTEDELRNLQQDYFDFSGGLNTKASDFIIKNNQSTVLKNARFNASLGALTKRDPLLSAYTTADSNITTSMHRYYKSDGTKTLLKTANNKLYTCDDSLGTCSSLLTFSVSGKRWSWITWNDLAIGTDGSNNIVKTDGVDASYLGTLFGEDAESGSGPDGTYTYKVTFYTSSYEVGFNVASPEVTVVDNDIDLKWIPQGPDTFLGEDIIGRKIYRTSDGGSDYKLLSNGTIADNSTLILTDSDTDAARGAVLSTDFDEAPPKGRFITLHESRLFIANNPDNPSRLYFSDVNAIDYFPAEYLLDIRKNDGDQITFVGTWLSNLAISKDNSWQYLYTDGADPLTDWAVSDVYTTIGCRYPYSAAITPYGIFFLYNNGIYNFNGQYSLLLSEIVTPTIEDIDVSNKDNVNGAYANNVYYLSHLATSSGETSNNRVLLYDTLSKSYSLYTMAVDVMTTFNSGSDSELLYAASSTGSDIFAFDNNIFDVIHREHDDFTGTFNNMRYVPTKWGGDERNTELNIAWDETIAELSGQIASQDGIVARDQDNGTYISQAISTPGIAAYENLYWNESVPVQGGDVTMAIRSAATTTDLLTAVWSGEFTNPNGSDISGVSADVLTQYRISATADQIQYAPILFTSGGYVVRMTYNKSGTASETSVPFEYTSGWDYLKYPMYLKELTKVEVEYEGTGTATLLVTNEEAETDSFTIDLDSENEFYQEFFTGGKMIGYRFKYNFTKDDISDLRLKRIGFVYNVVKDSIGREY